MINVGIVGYGNLGKAIEMLLWGNKEFKLRAIFSRRAGNISSHSAGIYEYEKIPCFEGDIDCLLLAGGSSGDLMGLTPFFASKFNTVDSFDGHSKIREHLESVDAAAKNGGKISVISAGWDPGFLSLIRMYSSAFMPEAVINTFWGEGISQGHGEALRRIPGVKDAIQFTIPKDEFILLSKMGNSVSAKDSHKRKCYITAEAGCDDQVEEAVRKIPEYFEGYETEIIFTDQEEICNLKANSHHKGRVIATSENDMLEFSISMSSNPRFTANIMLAAVRAAVRLNLSGERGARTFFDIPPRLFLRSDASSLL